jgi:hypothetical protein
MLTCVPRPDYSSGRCGALGLTGAPCFPGLFTGRDNCASGLVCDSTAASPTCQPLKQAMDACATLDACAQVLVCVGWAIVLSQTGVIAHPGKCGAPVDVGAACSMTGVSGCLDLEDCVGGQCQKRVSPLGQPCQLDPIDDCAVGYCNASSSTCQARLTVGSPCDTSHQNASPFQCAGQATCDPMTQRCVLACM